MDPNDIYGSTKLFGDQCQQMVDEWYEPDPIKYHINNIVICGMGGSAYGCHIVQSLCTSIKVPLVLCSDYNIPEFVDNNTLVILTSYSGDTEEIISCANDAINRRAKILGLTSGGKLKDLLSEVFPIICFDSKNNPSGQPRLGMGYIVVGTLLLLHNVGIINLDREELVDAINEVRLVQDELDAQAKEIASSLNGYIPLIFAAQHLVGNAHVIRNQFNETSKSFACFEDIPEHNHHLIEGLKFPQDNKLKALFLLSDKYTDKHTKRISLTIDIIDKNGIQTIPFHLSGSTKLSEVLKTLSFGAYLTLHLAIIYKVDPSMIPWVNYFKQELSK